MTKAAPAPAHPPVRDGLSFGPFRLEPAQQLLLEGDTPLAIGSRAFDILTVLVSRAGELVTKEELVARVWPDTSVDESNLRAQVAALRKALRDGRDGARYVATVPGRGYRFVARVSQVAAPSPRETPLARPPDLPARLTRTVGRSDVVAALASRLQRRRFITVVGPGGIGKTTVALAVAEALSSSYDDGAVFVDLAALTDDRLVASSLASALGLASISEDPTRNVVDHLRDQRKLVILDSCEHVVEPAALLAEQLLKGAPGVHLLATSREPLRADGESVHRLAPLDVPPVSAGLTAAEALTYSAVELFADRAAACIDGYALTDADAPHVAEICRRLDGIALAIELVARRVDAFGVAGVAERLDDRFRLLAIGRRTAGARHHTMAAALDWSFEFLPEAERAILRRVAIFSGSFTLAMAVAVAADDGSGECEVIDAIASLVAKSLIAAEVSGAGAHYRLLDTTRAYALEKLAERGERERTARRHAENTLAVMEGASGEFAKGSPIADWVAAYGRQVDNVRAALDWAFSPGGDGSLGVRLTVAAIPLWFQLQLIEECYGCVQHALESLDPGPTRDSHAREIVQLIGALGQALIVGFAPEAVAAFARALELAEKLGDTENQLGILFGLWTCRFMNGEYRPALEVAQKFCKIAGTTPEPADRLIGDRLLGVALHYLGEQARAHDHLERMLESYVAPTDRSPTIRYQSDQRVLARAIFARVLWLEGLPEQASRAAQRTVEDARAAGHPMFLFSAMALGEFPIALLMGDLTAAERSVRSMLEQAARHELGPWGAAGRAFDGALRLARGDTDGGLDLLRTGLAEMSRLGNWRNDLLLIAAVANGLGRSGAVAEGLAAIDDALATGERHEERWCLAELLRVKAEILLSAGAPSEAERHLHRSLDLAHSQDALSWELRSTTTLARLRRDQGRTREAHELLAPIYGRFREGFETADLVAAKRLLGELA